MRKRLAFALGAFALGVPLFVHAETFTFDATGGGFQSSGTLTVAATSTPGVFDVTGINGEVNGASITGVIPGSYDASNPTNNSNSDFFFDNLFYSGPPLLDFNGIGFNVGNAGYQVNFYFDDSIDSYWLWDSNNTNFGINFSVAPTPEPSSLLLLGTGLLGLAGVLKRRLVSKQVAPGLTPAG